ncbi:MAG: HAD family hydrolase [Atribacterota bacterium]
MEIKIISFDIDGTLVDSDYNDLIWHKAVPEMVAEKNGLNFEEAVEIVKREYDKVGEDDYRWYDIKYWISFFQLGVGYQELLQKYEQNIVIFSDVTPTLEQLYRQYQIISITSMPREFMNIKLKRIKKYFQETFSTLSEYKELKNKNAFLQISGKLRVNPEQMLHIGDHEKQDFIAAREAGWKVLLIDRSNTGLQEKYPDSVIHTLTELPNRLL